MNRLLQDVNKLENAHEERMWDKEYYEATVSPKERLTEKDILGAIAQSGRYIWAIDTEKQDALMLLLNKKIIQFKCQTKLIAEYVLVPGLTIKEAYAKYQENDRN